MAVELKNRTKALFEKAFPERQIYHRSGGSVRYVSISPWRQAMMAGGATVVVGWCLFATASVLLRGPAVNAQVGTLDRKIAKYERWLQQAQAKEAAALSLLEQRSAEFTRATSEFERRHDTLKGILASLNGDAGGEALALTGDGASVLINSSVEEADARQSRGGDVITASVEVAGFRAQIDKLRAEQSSFLDLAEQQAVERAEKMKGVIGLTGVAVARVLEATEAGGPLVEVSAAGTTAAGFDHVEDEFALRAREVKARLDEAKMFEQLIRTVPLGAPVNVPFRETSGFGKRIDPFNRRLAWHNGLDLAAFNGAPIVAKAPGVVSFAGQKSGYGKVVQIDHGHGFKTVYAHLSSISVREGDPIAVGQKVGAMGSTGRSTGPHLHYEVYFRGKAYDPIKFVRAGQHVH
ncbi:peptidoglycan DD-metalloendopeptidase family protein [bacterium]|nr:peptidoglycan DD-metalloendopeptidase family protein [bacterium]